MNSLKILAAGTLAVYLPSACPVDPEYMKYLLAQIDPPLAPLYCGSSSLTLCPRLVGIHIFHPGAFEAVSEQGWVHFTTLPVMHGTARFPQ